MKIGIAVGIVIAILALVVCLVPLKTVAYAVTVDYEDTEIYYVDEPYEVTEIYYEYEPWDELPEPGSNYEESIDFPTLDDLDQDILEAFERASNLRPKDYEVIKAVSYERTAYLTLRNTDTVGATFIVTFFFSGGSIDKEMYLEPGEQKQFIATAPSYDSTGGLTWSYSVWPGIEFPDDSTTSEGGLDRTRREAAEWLAYFTELEYRAEHPKGQLVEKERIVIKYQQVEKQRTVTRQRQETRYEKVTLLDYLLHY